MSNILKHIWLKVQQIALVFIAEIGSMLHNTYSGKMAV